MFHKIQLILFLTVYTAIYLEYKPTTINKNNILIGIFVYENPVSKTKIEDLLESYKTQMKTLFTFYPFTALPIFIIDNKSISFSYFIIWSCALYMISKYYFEKSHTYLKKYLLENNKELLSHENEFWINGRHYYNKDCPSLFVKSPSNNLYYLNLAKKLGYYLHKFLGPFALSIAVIITFLLIIMDFK
jgi:uncharacterized membrane protein